MEGLAYREDGITGEILGLLGWFLRSWGVLGGFCGISFLGLTYIRRIYGTQ